jgi:hypothetical protein
MNTKISPSVFDHILTVTECHPVQI